MKVLIILVACLHLSSAISIECEFKNDFIHDWKVRYSCRTKKVVMEGNERKVEKVAGDHLKEMQRENVTQFFARGLNIERFPQGLGEIFVNLEVVRITSCSMRFLLKEDMSNLENLKYLDLVGNKIEKLESNAFELVPNLLEVILNNNRLKFIGSEILKPLKKLEIVSFGGNVCVQGFAKHSEEQLIRLKSEIKLKCSDVSLTDVMHRIDDLEVKLGEILRKIDQAKVKKRFEENLVFQEGNFVVKLEKN